MSEQQQELTRSMNVSYSEPPLPRASLVIWIVGIGLRAVFKAPVRGVVKEITVTTHGGVIPQNGKLMTIVPIDEQLLIEARILPRDIAFIRPGQEALVKITAYDYSIYGGLKGKVTVISPDTIRDEVKQDQFYYRV
ncbi:cyclolysin secretion protein, partial [Acinetobacter baumannii]